jgi:uncharacterized protein (DUF433 family)
VDRLTSNPDVQRGQLVVRGMRISVRDVLGYLAAGMTVDAILAEFPYLEREDVLAVLAYAAEAVPDASPNR